MDGDRKYRQNGYQDTSRVDRSEFRDRDDRPRQQGPKPPLDITGPRLPRLVQTVTASRCYNCASTLMQGTDFKGKCPKCSVDLHCCKQCAHFEPSTRFQCLKPVPERITPKDTSNECALFAARVTVARDVAAGAAHATNPGASAQAPRTPADARAAFDNLFKK
jgi:hypothetical protein